VRRLCTILSLLCLGLVGPAIAIPATAAAATSGYTVREGSLRPAQSTAEVIARRADLARRKAARVAVKPMSKVGVKRFGSRVLREAARKAGSAYVYGAVGPRVFDCSGYTRFVYARLGITLPHSSYAQYAMTRHIPRSAARPGDLVFVGGLGHVGIYAGNGQMWDAPQSGGQVAKRAIYGSFVVGRVVRSR
jgi:cell wall-associated NlpC family hydrolase